MSKVGPGHPPMDTRFRKGQSGNPRGRPRKERRSDPASAFDVVVDKTLTIEQDGKTREVTVDEALQHKTYQRAIAGDRSAQRDVLKMIKKRDAYLAVRKRKKQARQVGVECEYSGGGGTDGAMLVLGIATRHPPCQELSTDPAQLRLEPWAVQAAFDRRPDGSHLAEQEIEEIRRCTRDPGTLRWPYGTTE